MNDKNRRRNDGDDRSVKDKCFGCKRRGHHIRDCPDKPKETKEKEFKKKPHQRRNFKGKKGNHMAAWGNSDEDSEWDQASDDGESCEEQANICLEDGRVTDTFETLCLIAEIGRAYV